MLTELWHGPCYLDYCGHLSYWNDYGVGVALTMRGRIPGYRQPCKTDDNNEAHLRLEAHIVLSQLH